MSNSADFHADPDQLAQYGHRLRAHAAEVEESFGQQHRGLESAAQGWAPASRAALQNRIDEWRSTSRTLTSNVDTHGHEIAGAGHAYAYQDEETSRRIVAAGPTVHLNLDI